MFARRLIPLDTRQLSKIEHAQLQILCEDIVHEFDAASQQVSTPSCILSSFLFSCRAASYRATVCIVRVLSLRLPLLKRPPSTLPSFSSGIQPSAQYCGKKYPGSNTLQQRK
jgi:hypothetical protein